MSNAAAGATPTRQATSGAVAGLSRSGVVVATTTASTASVWADLSALRAAVVARSAVVVPGSTTRRWAMPVRRRIHSSLTPRAGASSALDTVRPGTAVPSPCSTATLLTSLLRRGGPVPVTRPPASAPSRDTRTSSPHTAGGNPPFELPAGVAQHHAHRMSGGPAGHKLYPA